jgi:hypothetical protein
MTWMEKFLECVFCAQYDNVIIWKSDIPACEGCGRSMRLEKKDDTGMIRIIVPKLIYNNDRLALVERITPLSTKKLQNVRRASTYLEQGIDIFYEAFLENESKLYVVGERLSENPVYIKQDESWDMPTWVIDDGDELVDLPY